jgi:hypothetical protein
MNSRLISTTTAIVSLAIAVFFIVYFESLWRWVIASPLLVFVTWPSIKIGLFSSQKNVDKMTGTNKNYDNSTVSEHKESDRVWGAISTDKINKVQEGFIRVCLKEKLEQYLSSNDLPSSVLETVSEVTNEISAKAGISPVFIPLVVHQYVDSSHMLRVMHRDNWAEFMISRPSIAPQPESYLEYLNETYFKGQSANKA